MAIGILKIECEFRPPSNGKATMPKEATLMVTCPSRRTNANNTLYTKVLPDPPRPSRKNTTPLSWCRNSTLRECEDEIHTPKIGTWESSGTPRTLGFDCRGQTPHIGVLFISLESYRSVNVENGLAWAIWTSAAHVMAKRKVGSQIDNLTPNH